MSRQLQLWAGKPLDPQTLPLPDSVTQTVIHRAQADYRFLLGSDIISHRGTLVCGWGNSGKDENDRRSVMSCRRSTDDGRSWSSAELISPPAAGGFAHSHGVFFLHQNELYALVPRARYRKPCAMTFPGLAVELFRGHPGGDQWQSLGIVINQPFWPMDKPQRMTNGNYIMAGILCRDDLAYPAVAISRGDDINSWRTVEIPVRPRRDTWGEGGLIVNRDEIVMIFRNGWHHRPRAQMSISRDLGESWSLAADTNLPMSPAKPCCGILSTGQRYIVYNPGPDGRDTLVLAYSRPGEKQFSAAVQLRRGPSPQCRYPGAGKHSQWSYPLACEHNGMIYIVYAASKEDCAMSAISLKALQCSP